MNRRLTHPSPARPGTARRRALALAAMLAAFAAGPADAGITLEGDAAALTVVVDQVSRREVVAALAEKFALKTVGMTIEDSMVSGRFTGTLGQVLKSILPRNGYAIAYSNGRPVRVTFSANGVATPYQEQPMAMMPQAMPPPLEPQPPIAAVPPDGSFIQMQAESALVQGARAAMPPVDPQPPMPQPELGSNDMQRQIAESTARALTQLRQLTTDLKKVGP